MRSTCLPASAGPVSGVERSKGLMLDDVRPHDFRRTAASMMASAGVPRLTIAKVLNHISADAGVTAIYDRHSYDAEKAGALTWWDARVAAIIERKPAGTVLPFAKGA